ALVAGTAGRTHNGRPALYYFLDVIGRSEVAAHGLITDHVVAGRAGLRDLGRHMKKLAELGVTESPSEVLVDQRDAVIHVFQNGAHDLACCLNLGARGGKFLLALLFLGDVAGRADHTGRLTAGPALRDSALARP